MTDERDNITEEHAARRFHQMARLERSIIQKSSEIAECKSHLRDLQQQFDGLVQRLREAARDEGDLPLFNL